MEKRDVQSYFRMAGGCFLALALMYLTAMLSGMLAGGAPDAAYGIDAEEAGSLPENPVLTVSVWQKDEAEIRTLTPLAYRSPANCAPRLRYGNESLLWQGDSWLWNEQEPGMQGLAIVFSTGGSRIEVKWEHDGDDCGRAHGWLYGAHTDGVLDMARAMKSYDGTAEGHGELAVLWRGEGGLCYDTVTEKNERLTRDFHGHTTLAEVLGRASEQGDEEVTQDWMKLRLHVTAYDLLDNEIARATLSVTMTSGWHGAGERWNEVRAAALEAERLGREYDAKWLDYSLVKPTWTVELVEYWQTE